MKSTTTTTTPHSTLFSNDVLWYYLSLSLSLFHTHSLFFKKPPLSEALDKKKKTKKTGYIICQDRPKQRLIISCANTETRGTNLQTPGGN
jgi:hypothetical protein